MRHQRIFLLHIVYMPTTKAAVFCRRRTSVSGRNITSGGCGGGGGGSSGCGGCCGSAGGGNGGGGCGGGSVCSTRGGGKRNPSCGGINPNHHKHICLTLKVHDNRRQSPQGGFPRTPSNCKQKKGPLDKSKSSTEPTKLTKEVFERNEKCGQNCPSCPYIK